MTFPRRLPGARWANSWLVWSLLIAAAFAPARLSAQGPVPDSHRAVASREELEAAVVEAEELAESEGYSGAFRDAKRREAGLIRQRLEEGDFQIGDQIRVQVFGDTTVSGLHTVEAGRTLALPGLPGIPLRGVLRSEIEPYLTDQIGRYIRDPQVRARSTIRVSLIGGVANPGFYQLDADMMLSDALMAAGGILPRTEFKRSKITRGTENILEGEAFAKALAEGRSVDQLNMRAGDVVDVGLKPERNAFQAVQTIALIPGLILGLYGIGKIAGAF